MLNIVDFFFTQLTNDDPYILLNFMNIKIQVILVGQSESIFQEESDFYLVWSGLVWIQIEYWADGQKISNKNLHSLRWIFLSQKELCNFSKVLVTT